MARPASRSASTPSPRATLTLEEDGVRHTFHLDHAATVGRDPACDVLLSSPTVSRRHALVFPDGEGWTLRDLGSGNGTFLDARRVDEAPLPNGVALRFGSVPAWFEEVPEEPLTPSQKLQRALTQTLSIQPAKRARKKAAVAALAGGVALLLGTTFWHRGCSARGGAPERTTEASAPVAGSAERPG
ncbi:MAG TPA: FHA domain-containing protein [Thermoanaerobaculia bacterium]|nr:FHA domain-containing protein [Thermoanaerobaculia bacterium]